MYCPEEVRIGVPSEFCDGRCLMPVPTFKWDGDASGLSGDGSNVGEKAECADRFGVIMGEGEGEGEGSRVIKSSLVRPEF